MTDNAKHALFAGLCSVALITAVFAATAEHWMTQHNFDRIYQEDR